MSVVFLGFVGDEDPFEPLFIIFKQFFGFKTYHANLLIELNFTLFLKQKAGYINKIGTERLNLVRNLIKLFLKSIIILTVIMTRNFNHIFLYLELSIQVYFHRKKEELLKNDEKWLKRILVPNKTKKYDTHEKSVV
jgi:hypothetical protein